MKTTMKLEGEKVLLLNLQGQGEEKIVQEFLTVSCTAAPRLGII